MAAKGPAVTDDFVDMETGTHVEVGATILGDKVGAARLCQGG